MGRYRHQGPCQCAVGGLPLGCRVIGLYYPALPRVFTLPSLSSIQVAHGEPMPVWSSVNLCDCIPFSRLGVGFHPSRLPSTWVTVFLGWLPTALISPFQSVLSETDPSRIPQHQFRDPGTRLEAIFHLPQALLPHRGFSDPMPVQLRTV